MFLRLFATAVLVAAAGVAVGCSGPRYVGLDASAPDAAMPVGTLSPVSPSTLMLRPGQSATLEVRFLDATGVPRAGVVVAAAIEGTALDSTLGALTATTDTNGIARASLVAGTEASSFRVRLSAREASSAVFVDVGVGTSFGALVVRAPYTGMRPVTHRVIDVVPGTSCDVLTSMPPTGGGRAVRSATDDVTITALPTTLTYAVLVRANGDLALEAQGCVEGIVPSADIMRTVTVALVDVPLGVTGGYTVDLTLASGGWVEGRVHDWAGSLRTAVADGGGDEALFLNAVEAELARSGASADAAQLHMLRSSTAVDDALATQLMNDGTVPSAVIAGLLDEAGTALDAPTVRLALTLGAGGAGSLTTDTITTSDGDGGTVVLERSTPLVRGIVHAMGPAGTLTLDGPIDTQTGALALAWIDAVAVGRGHPLGALDILHGACGSLEVFASSSTGSTALAACDGPCLVAACATALGSFTALLAAGSALVDHDLDRVQVLANVHARDDDGDAHVDRLDGTLRGQLVAADGATIGPVDAVSGTLTGTRTPVP